MPVRSRYDWLRTVLSLGGGAYIDIIGYHDYNSWWTIPSHVDSLVAIRKSFGLESKPIWLTESSISSNSSTMTSITPAYSSIDEQAADVWRRSCLAWGKGVELFFWHGLWSSAPPAEWQEFGLVDSRGVKKKSFYSYRMLADRMLDFTSAELVSAGTVTDDNAHGGDGVWVVKFTVNGAPLWVMWSPDGKSHTLTGIGTGKIKVTKVVPSTVSANGETATFDGTTAAVSGGSATIALTGMPVLVEELAATSVKDGASSPFAFALEQNRPNPFNPVTTIGFSLPAAGKVTLRIFDVLGREAGTLTDRVYPAGRHEVAFDGSALASGLYFYRIESGSFRDTKKLMLVK